MNQTGRLLEVAIATAVVRVGRIELGGIEAGVVQAHLPTALVGVHQSL